MNHLSGTHSPVPVFRTDLDSDRAEDLTMELRLARYLRGMRLGRYERHARACRHCAVLSGFVPPSGACALGVRLAGAVRDALEDIETLQDCLVPLPAPPADALF